MKARLDLRRRKQIGIGLVVAFSFVMLMAVGPGVMIVNYPATFWGVPLLYVWGVVWYFALVGIALAADFFVWRHESDDEHEDHA